MTVAPLADVPLLILAGGRATRLGTAADHTPKFLMPVDESKCFADVQLEWAYQQGFRKIALSVGYLAEKIEAHCGSGERWKLQIRYAHDGESPLGTGGAVAKASTLFPEAAWWALTYGDTLLSLDCAKVVQHAQQSGCPVLMTVFRNTVPGHSNNATLEAALCRYDKKKPHPQWQFIDYGFLAASSDWLRRLPQERPLDLAQPLEELSRAGKLAGFEVKERFWEIGSPEALRAFQERQAAKATR